MVKNDDIQGTGKKSIRCPDCMTGLLNTPTILVQAERRIRHKIPIRVCWRCRIVLILETTKQEGWKFWNGQIYLDAVD